MNARTPRPRQDVADELSQVLHSYKHWRPEEDAILIKHVAEHGTRAWGLLVTSGKLQKRDNKACCNRFLHLKRQMLLSRLGQHQPRNKKARLSADNAERPTAGVGLSRKHSASPRASLSSAAKAGGPALPLSPRPSLREWTAALAFSGHSAEGIHAELWSGLIAAGSAAGWANKGTGDTTEPAQRCNDAPAEDLKQAEDPALEAHAADYAEADVVTHMSLPESTGIWGSHENTPAASTSEAWPVQQSIPDMSLEEAEALLFGMAGDEGVQSHWQPHQGTEELGLRAGIHDTRVRSRQQLEEAVISGDSAQTREQQGDSRSLVMQPYNARTVGSGGNRHIRMHSSTPAQHAFTSQMASNEHGHGSIHVSGEQSTVSLDSTDGQHHQQNAPRMMSWQRKPPTSGLPGHEGIETSSGQVMQQDYASAWWVNETLHREMQSRTNFGAVQLQGDSSRSNFCNNGRTSMGHVPPSAAQELKVASIQPSFEGGFAACQQHSSSPVQQGLSRAGSFLGTSSQQIPELEPGSATFARLHQQAERFLLLRLQRALMGREHSPRPNNILVPPHAAQVLGTSSTTMSRHSCPTALYNTSQNRNFEHSLAGSGSPPGTTPLSKRKGSNSAAPTMHSGVLQTESNLAPAQKRFMLGKVRSAWARQMVLDLA